MRSDPHPSLPGRALIVDVGSTMTKLALADGDQLDRVGSFSTGAPGAEDWEARFGAAISNRLRPQSIRFIAIASFSPLLVERLRAWWVTQHRKSVPISVVDPAAAPLSIDYRPSSALGPDRLANAVAAVKLWGAPVVIADVGTAITCDLVSAGRRFAGGAIAPGPHTAYLGLVDRAPHLALAAGLEPERDLPVAATSTSDAVRVGVLRGAAALIDSFATSYRAEVGSCPVIVTGGLGSMVARHCDTVTAIDPDLTLRGIHLTCVNGATTAPGGRGRHDEWVSGV